MKLSHAVTIGALTLSATAWADDNCGLSNGKKATGEPIQIGAIVGKTGPEDFSSSARAAEAYFKCVNANGGIHGRPIAYNVQDDSWNPEVASQVAAKLVMDMKVVAMVGSSSFVESGANAKMYEQEGVAVMAGVGVPRSSFFSRNYAPFNSGPRQSTVGAAQYIAEKYKLKKLTCVAPSIPGFGDWVCGGVESYGKANGVEVKSVLFDPGQLDGNGILLQIVATKPEGVVLGMPRGMMLPILTAAEQQNMAKSIQWAAPGGGYHADMPKAVGKYWEGRLPVHMEFQALDNDGPDTKNWKAIMAKYGQRKDPIDTFSQAGYLAAKTATNALLSIKGPVTRKSAYEAFVGTKNVRSDILCSPWYFGNGARHQANHTGRVSMITGGAFKVVSECFRSKDGELADVLEQESKGGLVN